MRAIRGATTVENDTAEEIRESVKELLCAISDKNGLCDEQIICILFSNTADLRSIYPAKAAREAGFFYAPLFSSLEPDIEGALEKCIRVMMLADTDDVPEHVYLRKAVALRRDLGTVMNIALDGPAGSGKSTVSKLVAQKFNILYLDTGAMYRACALGCLRKGVDVSDENAVCELIKNINIEIKYENGQQRTILDGDDVSIKIRQPEISMLASTVSSYAPVREKMVALQRETAKGVSCILDGRDIGTNVLTDAPFKFFLTAKPEVRAKRRYEENLQKGFTSSYEEILAEIIKRDKQDEERAVAPLLKADDAILIDSSDMTAEEVARSIINKIQEKI